MEPVKVLTPKGRKVGEVVLDESIFGLEPNIGVMHQVVTAQLAARRAGTHSTKGRAEVAGGGAKPWRQKGTGRARHGSIRAPQWRGGGAAHGPKPRDYRQRTPKKMKRLALASALSDRARSGCVIVVDQWRFDGPRTRDAVAALDAIGATGKVLVVLGDDDSDAQRSFRNLRPVHCLNYRELNTYDVLNSDVVVFTSDTLPTGGGENGNGSDGADGADRGTEENGNGSDGADGADRGTEENGNGSDGADGADRGTEENGNGDA